jgi:hypothetical protein
MRRAWEQLTGGRRGGGLRSESARMGGVPPIAPPFSTTLKALLLTLSLGVLSCSAASSNSCSAASSSAAPSRPYGPSGTLGPAGATTRTCNGDADCYVCTRKACTPSGTWQARIENASPGDTILLRAGKYKPRGPLDIPSGGARSPIIISSYGNEAAEIAGPVVLGDGHVLIEGLKIDAGTKDDWSILIESRTSRLQSDIELKNLDIRGGITEALRIRGNVRDITVRNSLLDGGRDHHVMKVMCDDTRNCSFTPENIVITNNRFSKVRSSFFPRTSARASEDLLQLEGAGDVVITHNRFAQNDYEECVDVKTQGRPGTSIVLSHNILNSRHEGGFPSDSRGCRGGILFHQDEPSGSTVIEGNWLPGGGPDGGNLIRATHARTQVINNLFDQLTISADEVILGYNTFSKGSELKLGDSTGNPTDLTITGNIFDQTTFRMRGSYRATNNLRFRTRGVFNCSGCVTGNPVLSGYRIQEGSAAQDAATRSFTVSRDIEGTRRPQGGAADIGAFELRP